jgi:hypothetical protein
VETFVVRVWLPDRPGALGQVASRIGAVRGDVVGIDILERGGGRVVDELVVQLPDGSLLDLLVSEITAVEDCAVEDVTPAVDARPDPRLDALETAAVLVGAATSEELVESLVVRARLDLGARWAAVADDARVVLAAAGPAPVPAWLAAFLDGSRTAAQAGAEGGRHEVAWAPLGPSGLALLVGRRDRPLRDRERRQLAALARIAGVRWLEVVRPPGVPAHPGTTG